MRQTNTDSLFIRLDHEMLVHFKALCAERGDTPQARLRIFIKRAVRQGKKAQNEKAIQLERRDGITRDGEADS